MNQKNANIKKTSSQAVKWIREEICDKSGFQTAFENLFDNYLIDNAENIEDVHEYKRNTWTFKLSNRIKAKPLKRGKIQMMPRDWQ